MEFKDLKFILDNITPFNKLSKNNLRDFIAISKVKEYKNDEIIYREGGEPDCFYILLKGRIVVSTYKDHKDSDIDVLKRGTCFGMISLFTDEPHSVTARSIETSYVLQVEKSEFKKFLEKNPLISLDLSRMLSQRVKARSKPKTIFQSKKIGIIREASVGESDYISDLARELKNQTKKKVIALQIASDSKTHKSKILLTKNFQEETAESYIVKGDSDTIYITIDSRDNFFALLNFISERYHFVIYEIPHRFLEENYYGLVNPVQQLHFLIYSQEESLASEALYIQNLKIRALLSQEKIKIILLEPKQKEDLTFERKQELLGHPIYATLPFHNSSDYKGALRRISREIGEVVLGVALGSGAAYGFSHIGVLKILEQEKVTIDIISGSSMGAVVAAFWAAGFSFSDTERFCAEIGKKIGSFSIMGLSFPFRGIMKAGRLESIFKSIFKSLTFYDLKHTLKVVSFDFAKRSTVILSEGFIYKALAASCAFPGIFEPIKFRKDILLDGGVLNPLPTEILVGFNANKIIASNITLSKEQAYKEYRRRNQLGILDFIFGSIETMQQKFIEPALKMADVIVHPNLEGLGWTEFNRITEFIKRGEKATLEKIEEIKELINA
ncbi:MAG: patatin-like phospholipase family protein [Candidatus Omnitrophica bacterium]|jgi:NTE family protein|nr:patatin-like phospholipase family protein [Candidatus Omnitrophota bacterium]